MALLQIENLSFSFAGKPSTGKTLDRIDLEIREKENHALIGSSASGKSTLAKLIMGFYRPSAGRIFFRGEEVKKRLPGNSGIQMISQNPYSSLNPKMRVEEIIAEPLWKEARRIGKPALKERVSEICEKVGLSQNTLQRFPGEFSGGQRQRIAIARALILRPALMIADEPFSALDYCIRARMIRLLQKLQQEHEVTYLLISHDLEVIPPLAPQVSVLSKGKIVESGKTDAIFQNPREEETQKLLKAAGLRSKE